MNQQVILVDERDNATGTMEKMEAHQQGLLHRAFSVFIFNSNSEMLLQQRAMEKYHSAGLWSNTCCSHPGPGEDIKKSALKRLKEEMGFETPIFKVFDFVYKAGFENGLMEFEYDHVFAGVFDGPVSPDPHEVMNHRHRSMAAISRDLATEPQRYTAWFHLAFPRIEEWWKEKYDR